MKFMIAPRGAGKSTYMLRWMQEAPKDIHRVVVFRSEHMANHFSRVAKMQNLPLEGWQFVTLDTLDIVKGRGNIEFGMDDIDMILQNLVHSKVSMVTGTGE